MRVCVHVRVCARCNELVSSGITSQLFLSFVVPYGACSPNDSHCFGRLPDGLVEADSELLAIDSAGNIYRYSTRHFTVIEKSHSSLCMQVAFRSK